MLEWLRLRDMEISRPPNGSPFDFLQSYKRKTAPENGASPIPQTLLRQLSAAISQSLCELVSSELGVEVTSQVTRRAGDYFGSPSGGLIHFGCMVNEDDTNPSFVSFDGQANELLTALAFGGIPALGDTASAAPFSQTQTNFLSAFAQALAPQFSHFGRDESLASKLLGDRDIEDMLKTEAELLVVVFTISAFSCTGHITLASPLTLYGAVYASPATGKVQQGAKLNLEPELARSKLRVEARVTLPGVTLSRIGELRCGDILPIPKGTLNSIELQANGEPLFLGKLGQRENMYSMRITEPVSVNLVSPQQR